MDWDLGTMIDFLIAKEQTELAQRVVERRCGDCRLCCTLKAVDELNPPKAAGTPCWFACGIGCSIHEKSPFPAQCRDYYCAWRLGMGGEGSRPDKCGAVVDIEQMVEDSPQLGIKVTASAPYKSIPIKRVIRDAKKIGIGHVAFISNLDDTEGGPVAFTDNTVWHKEWLSRHAGIGRTPWNKRLRERDGAKG